MALMCKKKPLFLLPHLSGCCYQNWMKRNIEEKYRSYRKDIPSLIYCLSSAFSILNYIIQNLFSWMILLKLRNRDGNLNQRIRVRVAKTQIFKIIHAHSYQACHWLGHKDWGQWLGNESPNLQTQVWRCLGVLDYFYQHIKKTLMRP